MAKPQAAKVPAATVKELPPAEALKEQGNTALKQGKLQEVTPIMLTLALQPTLVCESSCEPLIRKNAKHTSLLWQH